MLAAIVISAVTMTLIMATGYLFIIALLMASVGAVLGLIARRWAGIMDESFLPLELTRQTLAERKIIELHNDDSESDPDISQTATAAQLGRAAGLE